ncbi:MAG: aldolase [Betaproteobacteria bacterium]|nr:MAG: aldolase [Betaproteobacteria bacterium]
MAETVESALRRDLACALRWAARYGLHEGVCNHFSVRIPGPEDRFLINPQGLHWSEIGAGDLLVVAADGRVLAGTHTVEPTAFFIHSSIHRALPDAACVMHTHMPCATTLTVAEDARLEWASQNALRFYGRVAYESAYNGLALDADEGARLADKLRAADVLFLANHGVIVRGASIAQAFDDLYYLERACMLQINALAMGKRLRIVPEEVARRTAQQMAGESQQAELHLAALKRILDRESPEWSRID